MNEAEIFLVPDAVVRWVGLSDQRNKIVGVRWDADRSAIVVRVQGEDVPPSVDGEPVEFNPFAKR